MPKTYQSLLMTCGEQLLSVPAEFTAGLEYLQCVTTAW